MSEHWKKTEPEGSKLEEEDEKEEEGDEAEDETRKGILLFGRRVFVREGCLQYPIRAEYTESHVTRACLPGTNGMEWSFGCVAKSVCVVSFELESRLARIESSAFSGSPLQSIIIPRTVEILCSECFSSCKCLSSISFESESRLTRIESSAFSFSSLQSIIIQRRVEILCSSCFDFCESLSSISFEGGS
jgi:hypothetical protein